MKAGLRTRPPTGKINYRELWSALDVNSRFKLIAYSREKPWTNGLCWYLFVQMTMSFIFPGFWRLRARPLSLSNC
jgi:hypothetical protein